MTVRAKICGINAHEARDAALAGDASHLGFVFFPPSPRAVTPEEARSLTDGIPQEVGRVGLFVDPKDHWLTEVLATAPLDLIQLHGDESPARCAEIHRRTGCPIMKALAIAVPEDLDAAEGYLGVVDWLMFDGKPPPGAALPGGNAVSFDWRIMSDRRWPKPWMLAGGLHAENIAKAVRLSGAAHVDISSGVEDEPGRKPPEKIAAFLETVAALP